MRSWESKWVPRGSFWILIGLRFGPGGLLGGHLGLSGWPRDAPGSILGCQRDANGMQKVINLSSQIEKVEGWGQEEQAKQSMRDFACFFIHFGSDKYYIL